MPGLQGEHAVAAPGSPVKKSKLSLKFFQKKETKRALDFSEHPIDKPQTAEEPSASNCDQVVPGPSPCPTSPGALLPCAKKETLVPFVGLNNLGNTCYLNSILQVLYYCPGLRDGIKKLYSLSKKKDKPKEETAKRDEEAEAEAECSEESAPAHMELLGSFNSFITSVEQLQSSFLLNPDTYSEGELATPPRRILHTLRQLNPMYEGHLQHDAQEVLQCILGYIQDACETIRKEQQSEGEAAEGTEVKPESTHCLVSGGSGEEAHALTEEDAQTSGKRKSDTEAGNAKKKPKSAKAKKCDKDEKRPNTRSKRKSSSDITPQEDEDDGDAVVAEEELKKQNGEEQGGGEGMGGAAESSSKVTEGKRKKRAKLGWLRPSGKQPSIFSKFRSMGKISAMTAARTQTKTDLESGPEHDSTSTGNNDAERAPLSHEDEKILKSKEGLDLMERLFQGRLVLRTRCLECESYTERREDFQDISVPVQEDQPSSPDDFSEVSPDPKSDQKTLKWAISQFASVERIVGEDKYFCETCRHYTEAERSLLFDKTPEVITIHLKCFSANGLELDPYAGLSKVNTPLQTPLTLSLEEWSTQPAPPQGRRYQLFAVVMHSGVTISSGHYTTYVRMSELEDVRLRPRGRRGEDGDEEEEEEEEEEEQRGEGEGALRYDDGEVSFSLGGRGPSRDSGKAGAKKASEGGVGLLGGQRSVASYELGAGGAAEGTRRRQSAGAPGPKKEPCGEEAGAQGGGAEARALSDLLRYEGKWMLFDDSEVRLLEEDDFLRACSPESCSTSTPYLLFYRRTPPHTAPC